MVPGKKFEPFYINSMNQDYIRYILWAVIIVIGVGAFWYYSRKKD
jgi:hypothetical protein